MPKEETPILSVNGEILNNRYFAEYLIPTEKSTKLMKPLKHFLEGEYIDLLIIESEVAFAGTTMLPMPAKFGKNQAILPHTHMVYVKLGENVELNIKEFLFANQYHIISTKQEDAHKLDKIFLPLKHLTDKIWHNEYITQGFEVATIIPTDRELPEKMVREIRKHMEGYYLDIRICPAFIATRNSEREMPEKNNKHIIYFKPSQLYEENRERLEIGNTLGALFEYRNKEIPRKSEKK